MLLISNNLFLHNKYSYCGSSVYDNPISYFNFNKSLHLLISDSVSLCSMRIFISTSYLCTCMCMCVCDAAETVGMSSLKMVHVLPFSLLTIVLSFDVLLCRVYFGRNSAPRV
jgi:hypothetical protein